MKWLHPDLESKSAQQDILQRWQQNPDLRLSPFLSNEAAAVLLADLQSRPFQLSAPTPGCFRYQYWILGIPFSTTEESPLGEFCRWFSVQGAHFFSACTGSSLRLKEKEQLLSTLYTRGCYLDPHNDYDGLRSVAYIIGLTAESWPSHLGGWLEFLQAEQDTVRITEARPPGWNTIDLFDVSRTSFLHQVSMLLEDRKRRAITGWLYEERSEI